MNNLFELNKDKKTILSIRDKNVKEIDIPKGVTIIGDSAFSGCSSLKSIVIPDSVTGIYPYAFSRCTSLKNIIIHCRDIDEVEVYDDFGDINFDECILHIPSGTRWEYRHHPIFGKFKNIITERF